MSAADLGDGTGAKVRQAIYEAIRDRPGIHKSELCRVTGQAWGNVSHHLRVLREMGLVRVGRVGGKLHMATVDFVIQSRGMRALMLPHAELILRLFRAGRPLGVPDLKRELAVSAKVARKHLRLLEEEGLVTSDGAYRPRYMLSPSVLLREPQAEEEQKAAPAVGQP